jgi:hypothetical protein
MVIVCSFLVALPALAESNVRIVRLSYIDGDAQINTSNQDNGFSHAVLNMPVTAGMWVYTPNGSHAEIQFENGSTVRLVDDAQVQFEKLALADSGGKINIVSVDHGVVYLNFDKVGKDDLITIKAGGRTFEVQKSAHLRVMADDTNVLVSVFMGESKLEGDKSTDIKSKETLLLAVGKPEDVKVFNTIEELGSDSWDKHRDSEVAKLDQKKSPFNYPNGYDAQFAYLGNYGTYTNVPGYGWAWQPNGMGMGWDPFSNGVWNYYPGSGYMWISSYPWGWGPYRYGMWNFVPAYGWMWMPGSSFTAWNVGPRFGNVPAGYHAPVAPAVGGTSAHTVVVGHPPNLHPAVASGNAHVVSHSAEVRQSLATKPVNTMPVARGGAHAQPVARGTTASNTGTPTHQTSGGVSRGNNGGQMTHVQPAPRPAPSVGHVSGGTPRPR